MAAVVDPSQTDHDAYKDMPKMGFAKISRPTTIGDW